MNKFILWSFSLSIILVFWVLGGTAQAQLFQNNNTSCEDQLVVGTSDSSASHSIACGRFNDDTASGNPDFPDCATQRDAMPQTLTYNPPSVSNTVLINTGAHGQNCLNAGGNNQFQTPIDLNNEDLRTDSSSTFPRMGTIRTGNLDDANFDDLAFVFPLGVQMPPGVSDNAVQFLFSQTGGGFGSGDFTPSGESLLSLNPDPTSIYPFPINPESPLAASWPQNANSERSLVLLDCDEDGLDEGVVSVRRDDDGSVGISVMPNNGAGLEDTNNGDFYALPIPMVDIDEVGRVSLAKGDFNGDGRLDIMAAVDTEAQTPDGDDLDSVVFCSGEGSCRFNCPNDISDPRVFVLETVCTWSTCDPNPTSIIGGDFNGDGLLDVAVTEPDLSVSDILYMFNNGGNLNSWDAVHLPIFEATPSYVVTAGRFSLEAFQSNTDELAYTIYRPSSDSRVDVVTTDGNGGLNIPTNLNFSIANLEKATAIEAKDFDHCGGDDIIALAQEESGASSDIFRYASLFLNANEPPTVTATSDTTATAGIDLPVTASCVDPTDDDRTFDWTVVNSPSGSTVTFSPSTGTLIAPDIDASTNFLADSAGSYTIQITCTDFCGLIDSTTLTIDVEEAPAFSQGGCIRSSLLPLPSHVGMRVIWWIFLAIPGLFVLVRSNRKKA